MDMQRLFERIADDFAGDCQAEELRPEYARLVLVNHGAQTATTVEIFPYEARTAEGSALPLVRVQCDAELIDAVLVSPIPSAIIAVALR